MFASEFKQGPFTQGCGDAFMFAKRPMAPCHESACDMPETLLRSIKQRISFAETPEVHKALLDAARTLQARERGDKITMQRKFDDLLRGLLTNFDKPDHREIRYAIPTSVRNGNPQPVKQSAVPLAIVSELLTRHKVRLDTAQIRHWRPFVSRYGPSVMAH